MSTEDLGWGDPGYHPEDANCNRPCGEEPFGCQRCEFSGNFHRTEYHEQVKIRKYEECDEVCDECGGPTEAMTDSPLVHIRCKDDECGWSDVWEEGPRDNDDPNYY